MTSQKRRRVVDLGSDEEASGMQRSGKRQKEQSDPPHDEQADLYAAYPLDATKRQIRVLQIRPGDWEDPIECGFKVIPLEDPARSDEALPYAALSYVWGEKEPSYTVTVDGIRVTVRHNLYTALRRLRAHSKWKYVWTDALCIDQESLDERNSQVALMGAIYKRCTEVIVWLGLDEQLPPSYPLDSEGAGIVFEEPRGSCMSFTESNEASWLANDGDERLRIGYKQGNKRDSHWETILIKDAASQSYAKSVSFQVAREINGAAHRHAVPSGSVGGGGVQPRSTDFTNFVRLLATSDWFQRVWVVQEFMLAPGCQILFGCVVLPFEVVMRSHAAFRDPFWNSKFMHPHSGLESFTNRFAEKARLRDGAERNHAITLIELRLELGRQKASLDVDQIYSLLGVCRTSIRPDYSKPLYDVYTEVSLRSFNTTLSFTALTLAGSTIHYSNKMGRDLPSWAFHWKEWDYDDDRPSHWAGLYKVFNASDGLSVSQEYEVVGRDLHLSGAQIDTIAHVSATLRDESDTVAEFFGSRCYASPGFRDYITPLADQPYVTGETWPQVWARTFYLDHSWQFEDRPPKISRLTLPRVNELVNFGADKLFHKHFPWPSRCSEWRPYRHNQEVLFSRIDFEHVNHSVLRDHRLFITRKGYLGLARGSCDVGDNVFMVGGCNLPLILRKLDAKKTYGMRIFENGGGCYLHGFMDGIKRLNTVIPEPEAIIIR